MASVVTIAILLSIAYAVLFVAFVAISRVIRAEDNRGTLVGSAPGLVSRSVRRLTGYHRVRWTPQTHVETFSVRR